MPHGIAGSSPMCAAPGCDRVARSGGFCTRDYERWRMTGSPTPQRPTAEERFWAKVNRNGPVSERAPHLGPCWEWLGATNAGYGWFNPEGRAHGPMAAYRWAYKRFVGPVPAGLCLDHLCHYRLCVNPAHLEPVTLVENKRRGDSPFAVNARKTHCARGHELTYENTYHSPACVGRVCAQCRRDWALAAYARKREANADNGLGK